MKAISILALLFTSFFGFSQTIVSTNIENKNVILEEFTGIHCGWCPQGHITAQGIMDNHPNDVFLINIHTGYYANPSGSEPDFRTPFGNAIASQSGLTGYPSGTVNRHLFSGSATALDRGQWTGASDQILAEQSYVNVGVEATLNLTTRELAVHVEAYYTNDSPESTNKLNVVVLQDSTHAYQASGGSNYNHMHRLVHMITEQWGEEITTTSSGSFVDKSYIYSIPAEYNGIPVDLMHMKVVAFISENNQEIISGNGTYPTYTGAITQNDAGISEIQTPNEICENEITPVIKIVNTGQNNLTSLQFEYRINTGSFQTYNWNGNLAYSKSLDVVLDPINFTLFNNNTIDVIVSNPNGFSDENYTNNSMSNSFNEAYNSTNRVSLEINPNGSFGLPWTLKDNSGTTIYSGTASGSDLVNEIFELTLGECYTFNISSSSHNGIPGDGYCKITDSDGYIIFSILGNEFTDNIFTLFKATTVASVSLNKRKEITIYPNPTNKLIVIENLVNKIQNIEILDISGKIIFSKDYNNVYKTEINTSNFNSGIYFVNIDIDNEIITKKISVIK